MQLAAERSPRLARVSRTALTIVPYGGLVLVLILAAILTPTFYSGPSLTLVLFQIGFIGLTAVGQTFVLLTGGIDLSIGAVIGLTTVIIASESNGDNGRLAWAIILALLAGIVVSFVNAGLVIFRSVPPFVATFATFVLVQGSITAWTRGAPSGDIPSALGPVGAGKLLGLPWPTWIFVVVLIASAVVLGGTSTGRRIYATGANPVATRLSGIRTTTVIGGAYLVCALLAVLVGIIDAGYVGHVDAQLARSLNLDSIAAAVIGGVALTGGRGTIANTTVGVLLLAVLIVWMTQLGAGIGGRLVVEGIVIAFAAWLQGRGQVNPLRQ